MRPALRVGPFPARRRAGSSVLLLLFLLSLAGHAHPASFACDRAATRVEKAVCADEDLSTLDEHLGRYYTAARSALKSPDGGAEACLVDDQKAWLRSQRDRCGMDDDDLTGCLRRAYLERLATLDPLQPGATSVRDRELPRVARSLVWIVPPAADQVAAPRNGKNRTMPPPTLVAQGQIVDEVSTGDGFVLRTANDDRRLLIIVPLMFLEPSTSEQLSSLARSGGRYELRGYASETGDGSGTQSFASSRCVLVYRVAPDPVSLP